MYKRLSYCIYIIARPLVNTNNYSFDPMRLVQKSFRPDNPKYWQLFLRSTDDITEWEM